MEYKIIKYERYETQLKEKGKDFYTISKNLWQILKEKNGSPNGENRNEIVREKISNQLYILAKRFLTENQIPYSQESVMEAMSYISIEAQKIKEEKKKEKKDKGLEGKL